MDSFTQTLIPDLLSWATTHGVKIFVIIIAALLILRFGETFVGRLVKKLMSATHFLSEEAKEKREKTLAKIFNDSLRIVVGVVAVLMILQEFGVAITPLLTAVGVAGLALGFGGQYLIRDLVAGLFIILENQYRVGDVIGVGETCGLVEDISLRMTTIRDIDGTVHHIPHGEIEKIANLSKQFARVNLNVGIAYDSKLEHVIVVVNKVGHDLAKDKKWKDAVLKPPQFLRVDDFGDSAIIIKILGETKPLKQWEVMGELRKRLKIAFDKEKIEIPLPQRVVHQPGRRR